MKTIKNINIILLICVMLLSSYILIMDDKQLIINPNINNLCKNNGWIFILTLICLGLLFYSANYCLNRGFKNFLHYTNTIIQQ